MSDPSLVNALNSLSTVIADEISPMASYHLELEVEFYQDVLKGIHEHYKKAKETSNIEVLKKQIRLNNAFFDHCKDVIWTARASMIPEELGASVRKFYGFRIETHVDLVSDYLEAY
jgi:hypothetical protein